VRKSSEVLIIGAGVVGLCIADELLSTGLSVTIIDNGAPAEGCSYGNGGLIVPSHFVPLAAPGMVRLGMKMMLNPKGPFAFQGLSNLENLAWAARFMRSATRENVQRCAPLLRDLNLRSLRLYEKVVDELDTSVGFEKRGLLMLSRTESAHKAEARLAGEATALGLRTSVLDPQQIRQLEPDLTVDCLGAVLFHDDAHLTTHLFMHALRAHLQRRGAQFVSDTARVLNVTNAKVTSLTSGGDDYEAGEYIIAAGAWSGEIAGTVGLRLPLLAGKGYGFTVPDPPQKIRTPAILTEARVAVTPMSNGTRFVGTMELGPPNLTVNRDRVQGMRESIGAYYPSFTGEPLDQPVWAGLRPCSPDGMPYIGRTERASNLLIATGHGMMGMSLGPVTGELIRQLLTGQTPTVPLELMSPDRFH
jgi:D-amino-acid dehydrogenase